MLAREAKELGEEGCGGEVGRQEGMEIASTRTLESAFFDMDLVVELFGDFLRVRANDNVGGLQCCSTDRGPGLGQEREWGNG